MLLIAWIGCAAFFCWAVVQSSLRTDRSGGRLQM